MAKSPVGEWIEGRERDWRDLPQDGEVTVKVSELHAFLDLANTFFTALANADLWKEMCRIKGVPIPTRQMMFGDASNRYFIKLGDGPEREVSLTEYCAAERNAGFYPKGPSRSDPEWMTTPATASFSNGSISGRIVYALRTARLEGWQPISTAPRDGTQVDLWFRPHTGSCRRLSDMWWNPGQGWRNGNLSVVIPPGDEAHRITHWRMPPEPPYAG